MNIQFLWKGLQEVKLLMEQGGSVLYVILLVSFLIWLLIWERFFYLMFGFRKTSEHLKGQLPKRSDLSAWHSSKIRSMVIDCSQQSLNKGTRLMGSLIAICPLLGLLGTVTGMIQIFSTIEMQGTSNPRLLASGISMATIPTLAGLFSAIVGLFFLNRIQSMIAKRRETFGREIEGLSA